MYILSIFVIVFNVVVLSSVINCDTTNEEASNNNNNNKTKEISTSLIDLDKLPELFSNEKLPNANQETNRCFDLLDCLQTFPIDHEPIEPYKLEFSIKIYRRNTQDSKVILFDRYRICLKSQSEECQIYPYDLNLLLNSTFNPRSRTIIVIPGYRSKFETDWQVDIKDRWLKLENANVITVGWNGGNEGIYEKSVANAKLVSRQLTVLLYYLATLNKLNLFDESFTEKILFVGHSLGAHISGFVGKDLNGLVGRITGLDPAGPQFNDIQKEFRLDKSDAKLVDAIHSNGCPLSIVKPCYGLEKPIAHLDYYANDGKHQPQCSFDAFGCSHGASIHYYRSFLDHEIYTRDYLDHKYHKCYRLFAIPGAAFEDFHNGTSLAKSCPITSLDDYDLYSKDVNNCTIPIDFITWYDKFRHELIEKYNVDFDNNNSERKYFFYTSPAFPYINNHNFIKIRISKLELDLEGSSKEKKSTSKVCDLILHVRMESGAWMKNEIKSYELLDRGDHYEVLLPYISTDSASKYELAKLDANDFYLSSTTTTTTLAPAEQDGDKKQDDVEEKDDNYLKLQTGIKAAFPKTIELIGLQIGKIDKKKKKGILDVIKNFFGMAKNDDKIDKNKLHECSLNVETITIQPLKKIHRHFVASYSMDANDKEVPDIIILKENDKSPKIDLLHGKDSNKDDIITKDDINSEIYIDTVIIGPRDNTIDVDDSGHDFNEQEESIDDGDGEPANVDNNNNETSREERRTGSVVILALTISMISAIIIVISIFGILYIKRRIDIRGSMGQQDKRAFIHDEQFPSFDNL